MTTYVKTYEAFFANTPDSGQLQHDDPDSQNSTYAVGDVVNITYWLTGDPISCKIEEVKSDKNGRNLYVVSFDLRSNQDMMRNTKLDSNLFNAPRMTISNKDIINAVSKINTPAGPDWVLNDPNLQIHQVSNDIYM